MQQTMWRDGRAALLGAIALFFLHVPRLGAMELLGQAGEGGSGPSKELSGPVKMKHVGICTQDGPEERAGEISLQVGRRSLHLRRAQDARL